VKKRTEILIEFDELVVINPDAQKFQEWCPICEGPQALLTPSQASRIFGVSVRTINRWVEANAVHFIETSNGSLLVCVGSIGLINGRLLDHIAPTSSAESGSSYTDDSENQGR